MVQQWPALQDLLKQKGYHITGSDKNVYPPVSLQLQELNIPISERLDKLESPPDLVVVGNVMTRKHEEVQILTQIRYSIYKLARNHRGVYYLLIRKSIVVCGTHGKTTCTALLSWVSYILWKKARLFNWRNPSKFWLFLFACPHLKAHKGIFIIEGDEYDSAFFDKVPKFIHYKPQFVILTSIEMDHIDIYS